MHFWFILWGNIWTSAKGRGLKNTERPRFTLLSCDGSVGDTHFRESALQSRIWLYYILVILVTITKHNITAHTSTIPCTFLHLHFAYELYFLQSDSDCRCVGIKHYICSTATTNTIAAALQVEPEHCVRSWNLLSLLNTHQLTFCRL